MIELECWRCNNIHKFKREPKERVFCPECLEENKKRTQGENKTSCRT